MLIPMVLTVFWWGHHPLQTWADQDRQVGDLEFNLAVEHSIASEFGTAPPEPFRNLIEGMGNRCHGCRQIATKKLQIASRWDQRWLFWGLLHGDPEVRYRSNAILKRMNSCAKCVTTGVSSYNQEYACYECHGWRTIWLWPPSEWTVEAGSF